jgi:two-component system cell cycle sensor histidine kinase/response regulator CckA
MLDRSFKQKAGVVFTDITDDITNHVVKRLHEHEQVLLGGAGLFNASDEVTREDWRNYVSSLKLEKNLPGILGVGYGVWLTPGELEDNERTIRADGFSEYRVTPEGVRPAYVPVIYIEPFSWRNQRALGYDIYTEFIRRSALDKARDGGITTIAAKITLVQETEKGKQRGMLMFVPVYRKGEPTDSVEQRQKAIQGFVYSAIRMNDFIYGTLKKLPQDVAFEIYSDESRKAETLMFSSIQAEKTDIPEGFTPAFTSRTAVEAYGKAWCFSYRSLPAFAQRLEKGKSYAALIICVLSSILLSVICFVILRARNKALVMAEGLRESQEFYRSIFNETLAPKLLVDPTAGHIVEANPAACEYYGYSREELIKRHIWDINTLGESKTMECMSSALAGKQTRFEFKHRLASGEIREVQVFSSPVTLQNRNLLYSVVLDITDRKKAEEGVRRANRTLRMSSECNRMLVRATDEGGLMNSICRIAVELGGYRLSWVGLAEADKAKSVRPVAQAGYEDGYLESVKITWDESERGQGPTGIAIRTGRHVISRDILHDPAFVPWREAAINRGFASSIALPLIFRGKILGALMIYASEPDAFDETEVELLLELSGDMAYGMSALRTSVEHKRIEKALQESEFKHRMLFDTAIDAIFLMRGDICMDCNARALTMFGCSREQIIGRSLLEYSSPVQPDGRHADEKVTEMIELGMKKGMQFFEWEQCRTDGTKIMTEVSLNRLEIGGETLLQVVMRDITDRKLAENELREGQRRYEQLAEQTLTVNWEIDASGLYTYFSHLVEPVFGYKPGELVGKKYFYDLHPEDGRPEFKVAALEVFARKEIFLQLENPVQTKDGRILWVSTNGIPISGVNGELLGYRGSDTDITERKSKEIEYASIIQTSLDGFWTCDASKRITDVNEAFCKMLGYTRNEIIGMSISDFKISQSPDELEERVLEVVRKGGARFLSRYRHRDGHAIDVEISVRYHPSLVNRFFIFARDITEQLQLQAQLSHSQKMEAMGQLSGGVAHDFNNLLSIINGYAQILLSDPELKAAARSQLQEILRAGESASSLTRQLLLFSRRQLVEPQVIDLNKIVSDMSRMLKRLVRENISITMENCPDLWLINADPGQMEQVIMNLAVNARDAMPDGGDLTVKTENVKLETGNRFVHDTGIIPGYYVMLSIGDTGCGMSDEVQEHIFEPFFTTKEEGKGTGLGLATVYGIVKQSNGYIDVQSGVGKGTTFKIYLPRHLCKEEQMLNEDVGKCVANGFETILLVEDNSALLNMTACVLESFGYRVLPARNSDEAVLLAKENADGIQLLLTDVIMPGLNGPELAKKLLSLYPNLKCMFVSGYTSSIIAQYGVDEGDVNFIQKPFSGNVLAEKVRKVLDGR